VRVDFNLAPATLSAEVLRMAEAVLILTDHSSIDYGQVVRHAVVAVDTRNVTRDVRGSHERVVKA
jgi:UDP-N-acetyl-D-glucosamine dehydrogenase